MLCVYLFIYLFIFSTFSFILETLIISNILVAMLSPTDLFHQCIVW